MTAFGWRKDGSFLCACGESFQPNLRGEQPTGLVAIHLRTCTKQVAGNVTDTEIRERLQAVDEDPAIDTNEWESGFLQSLLHAYLGPLSKAQRDRAFDIIQKYEGR